MCVCWPPSSAPPQREIWGESHRGAVEAQLYAPGLAIGGLRPRGGRAVRTCSYGLRDVFGGLTRKLHFLTFFFYTLSPSTTTGRILAFWACGPLSTSPDESIVDWHHWRPGTGYSWHTTSGSGGRIPPNDLTSLEAVNLVNDDVLAKAEEASCDREDFTMPIKRQHPLL